MLLRRRTGSCLMSASDREPVPATITNQLTVHLTYTIPKHYVLPSKRSLGDTRLAANGKVSTNRFATILHQDASAATGRGPRHTNACAATYSISSTYTILLCKALVAGIASSLPSLVLRSMLKQRRILMRMH